MTQLITEHRSSDRAYFRAFAHWQPGAVTPDPFRDFLSPAEIRLKAERYPALLAAARRKLRQPLDLKQDWDALCFKLFAKLENATLYGLFTGDRQVAVPAALACLDALERCERPYWTFSSCIGILDMDLRTAEVALQLSLMKCVLGDALTPEAHRRLARLMVERCLRPGLEAERRQSYPWMHSNANWRIILCGCFAIGGIVFRDEFPEWRELVEYGLDGVLAALATGDSAGGWNEGPGYWDYGLSYAVMFAAVLRTVTRGAVDLTRHPFLQKTGDFRLFMHAQPDQVWNWSDAGKKVGPSVTLIGLARLCQSPTYQWLAAAQGITRINHLYWYDPSLKAAPPPAGAAARLFPGLGVLVWRTGFGPQDAYVGVQAGAIEHFNHHCHMDLGNVVIHAAGRELLAEVDKWPYPYEGRKDPTKKGYQPGFYDMENQRWMRWDFDYVAAIGHNVLTLEGALPQPAIGLKARFLKVAAGKGHELAIIDNSAAYRPLATRVRRYVIYLQPDIVLLVDEVRAPNPIRARIHFHPGEAARYRTAADSFTFRHGDMVLLGRSLCPQAADHLVLGAEDRRTTYQPPSGLLTKRHRYVYVENLCRKPRLVFVTALQFGRSGFRPAEFTMEGTPATADAFSITAQRGQTAAIQTTIALRTASVAVK